MFSFKYSCLFSGSIQWADFNDDGGGGGGGGWSIFETRDAITIINKNKKSRLDGNCYIFID
jgi:hypothetical protein